MRSRIDEQCFGGCAVVVSHDGWFLDRIATHILALEGDSQVYWFERNSRIYEINRRECRPAPPHPAPPKQRMI